MIKKLDLGSIDKIITSASNGTLINISIYRPRTGKNRGVHMIDFKVSSKTLSGSPINSETHKEFLRTIKKVRQHIIDQDYAFIDLTYVLDAHYLKYRIVGKKAG